MSPPDAVTSTSSARASIPTRPFSLREAGRPAHARDRPEASRRLRLAVLSLPSPVRSGGPGAVTAPAAVLSRERVAQHQVVSLRLERREAGLALDLERLLERTVALVKGATDLAPPAPGLGMEAVPIRIGESPGGAAPAAERRESEWSAASFRANRIEAGVTPSAAAESAVAAEVRGRALVALIDRIDRFVREGRPALSLSLGVVGWTVEVARTGNQEVSITVRGPGARDFPGRERLDRALDARGLRLGELRLRAET